MISSNSATESWLACHVAAHVCALPLTGIIETMRPLPVEAFPKAPIFVAGVAIIRGMPIPVVDMRALMGEPSVPAGRYVTVKTGNQVVALAFDAVVGVHRVDAAQVTELPPLLKAVAGEAISQVGARDAELLIFLETSRLLPPAVAALFATRGAA
jgi:purine-binding chemotaxis protein CheW